MAKKKTTKKKCDNGTIKLKADPTAEILRSLAWAVAHPARVRIVRLLISREACVCGEIVDRIATGAVDRFTTSENTQRVRY